MTRGSDVNGHAAGKGMKGLRIGIDTGGTFTDIVLIDPQYPNYWVHMIF